jgi:hypothetical protein
MQTCTQGVAMGRGGDVIARFLHAGVAPGNTALRRHEYGRYEAEKLLKFNYYIKVTRFNLKDVFLLTWFLPILISYVWSS